MTLLLALDFIKSDVYACLHCTVQHLKYSSYLGSYWLLPNLGNYWLLLSQVSLLAVHLGKFRGALNLGV